MIGGLNVPKKEEVYELEEEENYEDIHEQNSAEH